MTDKTGKNKEQQKATKPASKGRGKKSLVLEYPYADPQWHVSRVLAHEALANHS
jgi:hypothetical protein